jgi:hypothetical protein
MGRPIASLCPWTVVICVLVGFLSGTASAAPILDQSCCSSTNDDAIFDGQLTRAQTFTVGLAGLLSRVELGLSVLGSGSVAIEIHPEIVAGTTLPLGPPLAAGTITWSSPVSQFFSIDISSAGLFVSPGQVLSIVQNPTDGGPACESSRPPLPPPFCSWTGLVAVPASSFDPYPGGIALTTTMPNPATFVRLVSFSDSDLNFRTFVDPQPVSWPATMTLMGLGLAAVAWHAHQLGGTVRQDVPDLDQPDIGGVGRDAIAYPL